VKELKEGEAILLILDDSAFPVKAAEALARKLGLEFERLGREGDLERCIAFKPVR
jgi:TusA-related sulfurtransferase